MGSGTKQSKIERFPDPVLAGSISNEALGVSIGREVSCFKLFDTTFIWILNTPVKFVTFVCVCVCLACSETSIPFFIKSKRQELSLFGSVKGKVGPFRFMTVLWVSVPTGVTVGCWWKIYPSHLEQQRRDHPPHHWIQCETHWGGWLSHSQSTFDCVNGNETMLSMWPRYRHLH